MTIKYRRRDGRTTDLVGRGVVHSHRHRGVVEDVKLFAAVRPRDELDVAVLRVEREVFDVERAVRLDERRIHPQYRAVIRYDRVRHHIVIKLVAGTKMHPLQSMYLLVKIPRIATVCPQKTSPFYFYFE